MALVGAGDPQALEAIFDRHSNTAFSLAYRMCGRQAMAEDIVQEAFIALWRTAGTYDPSRASVRSWLLSIVRHRAIDEFRRNLRSSLDVSDEHIRGALLALPDEQRRVIELAYFGGFTHTQIARMLELSVGTVKGRMRLGLTKLRVSLEDPSSAGLADRTHD